LPIQWTYYQLSDDHAHRASLVFTIESSLLDRFPTIDREMISNFRFLSDKEPTQAIDPPAKQTRSVSEGSTPIKSR